jgi:hypothetical protein
MSLFRLTKVGSTVLKRPLERDNSLEIMFLAKMEHVQTFKSYL